jgi:hypothetical protein
MLLIKFNIRYNSVPPSKVYEVNDLEKLFLETLLTKLQKANLNKNVTLVRMSDGTLAVEYFGYPIGKVKLQGKIHYMQVLKGLYKHYSVEGSIQDFIPKIDEWIKYIQRYIK